MTLLAPGGRLRIEGNRLEIEARPGSFTEHVLEMRRSRRNALMRLGLWTESALLMHGCDQTPLTFRLHGRVRLPAEPSVPAAIGAHFGGLPRTPRHTPLCGYRELEPYPEGCGYILLEESASAWTLVHRGVSYHLRRDWAIPGVRVTWWNDGWRRDLSRSALAVDELQAWRQWVAARTAELIVDLKRAEPRLAEPYLQWLAQHELPTGTHPRESALQQGQNLLDAGKCPP